MENEFMETIRIVKRPNRKISEIQPIKEFGINLIKESSASEMIDQIVEEPLRKACKELKKKGIETVMSSANKNNLLKEGEKALEKEDVKGKEMFLDAPTYESAGRGYAWIMINFANLSDENKEALFSLEETQNDEGENIGEKIVWFVEGKTFMDILNKRQNEEIKSNLDKKFEDHAFVLKYNSDRYPKKVAFLRMPIHNETTVIDVESYFDKLIERLKQQQMQIVSPSLKKGMEI